MFASLFQIKYLHTSNMQIAQNIREKNGLSQLMLW